MVDNKKFAMLSALCATSGVAEFNVTDTNATDDATMNFQNSTMERNCTMERNSTMQPNSTNSTMPFEMDGSKIDVNGTMGNSTAETFSQPLMRTNSTETLYQEILANTTSIPDESVQKEGYFHAYIHTKREYIKSLEQTKKDKIAHLQELSERDKNIAELRIQLAEEEAKNATANMRTDTLHLMLKKELLEKRLMLESEADLQNILSERKQRLARTYEGERAMQDLLNKKEEEL